MNRLIDSIIADATAPRPLDTLTDAELARLITLQHSLWGHRDDIAPVDADDLRRRCSRAIAEALTRLEHADTLQLMPVYIDALYGVAPSFTTDSPRIERQLEAYVSAALAAPSLTHAQETTLVAAYGRLYRYHLGIDRPDYANTRGRERVQTIVDRWIAEYIPGRGWPQLTLTQALNRLRRLDSEDLHDALDIDITASSRILRHYTHHIDPYPTVDYLSALTIRADNPDDAEAPHLRRDLARLAALLADGHTSAATALLHLISA